MDLLTNYYQQIYSAFADLSDTFAKVPVTLISRKPHEDYDIYNEDNRLDSTVTFNSNCVFRNRQIYFDELMQKMQGTYDVNNIIFWIFRKDLILDGVLTDNVIDNEGLNIKPETTDAIIFGRRYRITAIQGSGYLDSKATIFKFTAEIYSI